MYFKFLYNFIFIRTCSDSAMKQFLLHLDETNAFNCKFVLADLDDTHLFISSEIIPRLQAEIDDLMEKLSFPITKQD